MISRSQPHATGKRAATPLAVSVFIALISGISCTPTEGAEPTTEEYTVAMEAICVETAAALAALPPPPDDTGRADFALAAAATIEAEAELAREIEPPAILDGDHRAFVANTDQQAARWRDIAEIPAEDADELNRVSGEIGALTLGRDDLAEEMGLAACRRTRS